MADVFYALFNSTAEVEAAEREAEAGAGSGDEPLEFLHHAGRLDNEQAPLRETRASTGILRMAIGGGMVGTMLGGITSAFGVLSTSVVGSAFIVGLIGLAAGAFAGVFVGPTLPDPAIDRLGRKLGGGRVLVTVSASSGEALRRVEAVFRRHGATIDQHQMI